LHGGECKKGKEGAMTTKSKKVTKDGGEKGFGAPSHHTQNAMPNSGWRKKKKGKDPRQCINYLFFQTRLFFFFGIED
jgi:hypothetical protein